MKTFREFLEEAYLVEMQKQDRVAGKPRTPLFITKTSGRVLKKPGGKLQVQKSTRMPLNPDTVGGRTKQGMLPPNNPHATRMHGSARHAHGGGGSGAAAPGRLRGVRKLKKQEIDRAQRERGERPTGSGLSPEDKVKWMKAQRARSMGGGQ